MAAKLRRVSGATVRRRDFIKVIVGLAAAFPLVTHGQQQTKPVIGYLSFTSPDERPTLVAAFQQGLEEAGFVIGQNVAIEYRYAAGNYDRLPVLVAELVKIPVAVIAATGGELWPGPQKPRRQKFRLCSRRAPMQ